MRIAAISRTGFKVSATFAKGFSSEVQGYGSDRGFSALIHSKVTAAVSKRRRLRIRRIKVFATQAQGYAARRLTVTVMPSQGYGVRDAANLLILKENSRR
jgi:hypothetical protein